MEQMGQPALRIGPRVRPQLAKHAGLRLRPERARAGEHPEA
jgi:hypothetical protein